MIFSVFYDFGIFLGGWRAFFEIFWICINFFIQRTGTDFFVRVCWYFNVYSKSIVLIDIFCFLRFWEILFPVMLSFRVLVAAGDVEQRSWRSQELRGSPELQNGGLRALEEAWDDFLLEAFSCQV